MNCEISGCDKVAHLRIQWSGPSGEMQSGIFCKLHVEDLWNKMRGLLGAGMGTWTNFPVHEGSNGKPLAAGLADAPSIEHERNFKMRTNGSP